MTRLACILMLLTLGCAQQAGPGTQSDSAPPTSTVAPTAPTPSTSAVPPTMLKGTTQPAEGWVEHVDAKGRYKVSFPGKPKEKIDTRKVVMRVAYFQQNPRAKYLVTAAVDCFTPAQVAHPEFAAKQLDQAQSELAARGQLLNARDMEWQKHPGREVRIQLPNKDVHRSRLFVVGRSLYSLNVGDDADFCNSKDADRFFESFAVTEVPK